MSSRGVTRNGVSAEEEVFIQALIEGLTQRKAYMKAFPVKAEKWKITTIDAQAAMLFAKESVKRRYEEVLKAMQEKLRAKNEWTREKAVDTLTYVIDKNTEDLERINSAYEEEIELLAEQAANDPEKAKALALLILKNKKSRRVSAIHNQGIIGAAAELNKMHGYNEENINMNGVVQFSGDTELQD